jgi:hypothetical protein
VLGIQHWGLQSPSIDLSGVLRHHSFQIQENCHHYERKTDQDKKVALSSKVCKLTYYLKEEQRYGIIFGSKGIRRVIPLSDGHIHLRGRALLEISEGEYQVTFWFL